MSLTKWVAAAGRWSKSTNWSAGVPTSGDDAVIQSGGAATLTTVVTTTEPADPPAFAATLALQSNASLEFDAAASLAIGQTLLNQGTITLDPRGYDWAGAQLSIGATFTNQGLIVIRNGAYPPPPNTTPHSLTRATAASVVNDNATGRISVLGASTVGNQAALVIGSAAGFGTVGTVTGSVNVSDEGLIQFASGQLGTIAAGAALSVIGAHAYVADAGNVTSNSALTGLTSVKGSFALGDHGVVAIGGSLTIASTGTVSVDPGGYSYGGSRLAVATVLSNAGLLQISDGSVDGSTTTQLTAASLVNDATTGRIALAGSTTAGNQARLVVGSAAGFGTAGIVTGSVSVSDEGLIQFASGQIGTIETGASLTLTGPHAYVADAGSAGANSALSGLTSVKGTFGIANRSAVSISGSLAIASTGVVSLDAGPYKYAGSSLSVALTLSNSGVLQINDGAADGSVKTQLTAASIVNDNASGRIVVAGSTKVGNQAGLLVGSVAGFGTSGTVAGSVSVSNEGLVQFASGQIGTIATGATLSLVGAHAYVADAGSTNSNSALTGLTAVNGNLSLSDHAAVAVSGSLVNAGKVELDPGPYGYAGSSFSVGGTLTNTGTVALAGVGSAVSAALSFVNKGAVNVAQNATIAVLGGHVYSQAAGSTLVNGTLSASTVDMAGGKLEIGATGVFSGGIVFEPGDGQLQLDATAAPSNVITGFDPGNSVLFQTVNYDSSDHVVWSPSGAGGTLSVVNGAQATVAALHFADAHVAAEFSLTSVGGKLELLKPPVSKADLTDFSGDGRSDLMWQSRSSGDLYEWAMNGNTAGAGSGYVSSLSPANWQSLSSGDFNGDGHADLLWRDTNGTLVAWFVNGTQVTGGGYVGTMPSSQYGLLATDDLNGDQRADLLWQDKSSGAVSLWDMNGTQVSGGGYVATMNPSTFQLAAHGDFSGDGKADLLWQNKTTGDLFLWDMNDKTVTSGAYVATMSPSQWALAATGDFNGDRKTDLLWQDKTNGNLFSWDMNNAQVTGGGFVATMSPSQWAVAAAGDYTGDGKTDLLWQDTSGKLVEWTMNDAQVSGGGYVGTMPQAQWVLASH